MSMEIPINQLPPGDPRLVDAIVGQLKSKGIFDKFRKECLADVDTKPAFLNLRQRVDGQVKKFLSTKTWKSDLNKNQLRDGVRKNIQESGILDSGIDAIINQVVNPKIQPLILPLVEDTVYSFLQIEKPRRDIQEYDIHVQPVNVHHEEKNSFYGQPMSMPQPCPPYHPVYQEFPPDFHGGSDDHIVLPKATEIENDSINVEDSSISSESEISVEDKTEGEPKPPVQAQPSLTDIPMETDVISSGEDDILARASPDSSTSIQEKKVSQEAIKMEEDNAVDSFDSARKEADAMTAAVESLTLRDEKLKTNSETHETPKDTSVSLPLFDNKSLDSISSNTSGLSLSPTSHSKLTITKDSESHLKDESQDNSPDEMRSAQSTPVVDEKSLNESISSENSKSWIPYQLPKDMPSAERITIASFGPFGAESARVVEGASPVSVDDSQGSVEREDLQTTESKIAKVEKSEGEITSSSISSKSLPSPEYNKDATGISASDKDDTKSKIESIQESRHEETKEKERSKSKEKHSKERRRSKERERRRSKSKSKYDDHYSHHDKDKRHKRDKDDDRDKDRHSKGHHSGGAGRTPSSGDGGLKEKEKSKDHKSHSSSHSKSHTSSHSKSHSSSHSKSSSSSHSKTHSSSVSKEEKDKKEEKSDKKEGSQEKSDKSSQKSDKKEEKSDKKEGSHRESKHATVSQEEKSKDSVDAKQKERKNETKQKPVKLMEDNIFALHLGNSNKDAVLPKPVNSLTKKPVTPKPNVNSSKGSACEPSTKVKEGKEIKDNKNSDKEDSKNYKDSKNSDKDDSKDNDNSSQATVNDSAKTTDSKITKRKNTNDKNRERDVNALTTIDNKIDKMENGNDEDNEKDINANHTILNNKTDKKETTEKIHEKECEDVSPKSVNGLIKTPLGKRRKMPKRKSLDLNIGASTSDSDSGESVEKMKSRGKSVKKTVDLISDFLSEKSSSRNEVTKVSSLETLSNAIKRIPLKRVTIPLVSIRDVELEAATRSEKEILRVGSISEVDNLFNELFGNSSDESETEFEGFHSFANAKSTPARKMIKNVQRSSTIKKNVRRKNPTPIKKPYTKPKMPLKKPYLKPKMPKSMEYVVLCDSDSSDMEVGIVDLSLGAYSEDPKPNDFEGFDDEGSDESSNTADKKLRDYLSRFSFGNAMQIGDFISVESDDEEFGGEESTVFFNKKNTTRSVIEEIAAKQKLSPVQNASEEEETDEGKTPVVESITPAVNMESYKPFKKRKLSSLAEDIYSSPCKVLKTRPDAVQQSLAEEPVHKDLGLHTYSMLTPEEDRTSSREYEVDLGHRENSYSPLSPSSDSSSDAHLKHRNKAKVGEYRQSCTSPEVPS